MPVLNRREVEEPLDPDALPDALGDLGAIIRGAVGRENELEEIRV